MKKISVFIIATLILSFTPQNKPHQQEEERIPVMLTFKEIQTIAAGLEELPGKVGNPVLNVIGLQVNEYNRVKAIRAAQTDSLKAKKKQ